MTARHGVGPFVGAAQERNVDGLILVVVVFVIAIVSMLAAMVAANQPARPWAAKAVWIVVGLVVVACGILAAELAVNPSFYHTVFPAG